MIPNILPVAVVTGIMGLLGFPLNVMTIMVAPMLIGIAVDDTVHYFIHFKQEFARTRSYREANRETFRKIAKAIVSTSIVLAFGFAVFGFSIMRSLMQVGLLLWVGIMAALLADLWITPALFTFLKPFGKAECDVTIQSETRLVDA
jgi:predicted RND superfamily exporter protein